MSGKFFFLFVLFLLVGVFLSASGVMKNIDFNVEFVIAFGAFLFLYFIFCRVFKVSMPAVKLAFPLWAVDYFWYRKFRPRKARKIFLACMTVVFFSQPLAVFILKVISMITGEHVDGSGFYIITISGLALPVLFTDKGVLIESVIAFVVLLNFTGTFLLSVVMRLRNYSQNLKDALLRYPQFKAATKFVVTRRSAEVYRVMSDASISHEALIERKNEITNAVGAHVIEINRIGASIFDFLIGELEARQDEKGRYISKVAWESLEFVPTTKKRFIFFKEYNPASRITVPIGKSGGKTIYTNLMQTPHFGKIGISNSGKTSSAVAFIASNAVIDAQCLFIIVDIKKKGADFRELEVDPALLYSKERPANIPLWRWHETCPKLSNVFIVKSEETFVALVRYMKREIAFRESIIRRYPQASSLYDLEFKNDFVALSDERNPERLLKIFFIVDDFLVLKEEYEKNDTMMSALKFVEDMVSFVRYLKIHIGFMSQKGTVKVLENARDQLAMEAFGTPDSVSEYVLKKKISIPAGIGIFGFSNEETGQVGIACAPYIKRVKAAAVLAAAEKNLFAFNRNAALFLKAMSNTEGDLEVLEGISAGQAALLSIPVEN